MTDKRKLIGLCFLLAIIVLLCINILILYPHINFDLVKPGANFFIMAVMGAVFKELKILMRIKKAVTRKKKKPLELDED